MDSSLRNGDEKISPYDIKKPLSYNGSVSAPHWSRCGSGWIHFLHLTSMWIRIQIKTLLAFVATLKVDFFNICFLLRFKRGLLWFSRKKIISELKGLEPVLSKKKFCFCFAWSGLIFPVRIRIRIPSAEPNSGAAFQGGSLRIRILRTEKKEKQICVFSRQAVMFLCLNPCNAKAFSTARGISEHVAIHGDQEICQIKCRPCKWSGSSEVSLSSASVADPL
jgi:hypothetical protein